MTKLSDEIFWYFNTGIAGFKYPDVVLAGYERRGISALIEKGTEYLGRGPSGPRRYVFVGAKFKSLMGALTGEGVGVVGAWRAITYGAVHLHGIFSSSPMAADLARIHRSESGRKEADLEVLVAQVADLLKLWNTRVVISTNDSLPLERVWIAAARRVGATSVCMQHGLFTNASCELADGGYSDYMLAYDESQAKVIRANPRVRSVVVEFGYHSVLQKLEPGSRLGGNRVACFLGQPWGEYYPPLHRIYSDLVRDCADSLRAANIPTLYKPHPSEKLYARSSKWPLPLYRGSLGKAFSKFDAFLSVSSTALFEASLAGRLAIQTYCPALSDEIMQTAGYAWTLDATHIDTLSELVSGEPLSCPVHVCRSLTDLKARFRVFESTIAHAGSPETEVCRHD